MKAKKAADRFFLELSGRFQGFGVYIIIGAIALLIALAGLGAAKQSGERVDLEMRRELVLYATSIASSVDADLFKELSFTAEDASRSEYQTLCAQFRTYAETVGLEIYTMALRGDGQIVFGPESLLPDHEYASPPGTVFEMPTRKDFAVFSTASPQIQGPVTDEYGSFVSVAAPVIDPDSGKVLAAIGIDIEASSWRAAVRRAQWIPAIVTLILLSVLLAGGLVLKFRQHLAPERYAHLRHAETVLCAVFMTLLSFALAGFFHSAEVAARRNYFHEQARAQALLCAGEFSGIQCNLNLIVRFFESSEFVTREEFLDFCHPIIRESALHACIWLPDKVNPVDGKTAYYSASSELSSFPGEPDWLSSPEIKRAFQVAGKTGKAVSAHVSESEMVIVHSVKGKSQAGMVVFVVDPRNLVDIRRGAGGRSLGVDVCLFEVRENGPIRQLASSIEDRKDNRQQEKAEMEIQLPIFRFSRSYILRLRPQAFWLADHPLSNGLLIGCSGLLITVLFSSVVGLITNRRIVLQHRVQGRTAELNESKARYRNLARHLETVREEERKRLSRELHDDIGQIFTALKIDMLTIRQSIENGEILRDKMEDMQNLMSEGIQSVHSLCRRLRPGALDDLGIEEAIVGLVDDWQRRNKLECELCIGEVDDELLCDEIRTAVFRIIQEALTNVSRHSKAHKAGVYLDMTCEMLEFSIFDDGCGVPDGEEDKPTSYGLIGMHERIEALGGRLMLVSRPGQGTRITGRIPLA